MGRLFWKILIWFWLAMILTNVLAIVIITQFFWTPLNNTKNILDPAPTTLVPNAGSRLNSNNSVIVRGKPPVSFARSPRILLVRFGAALLIGGLLCAWLAWHLTKPIRQLSAASRQLANGNLSVRVAGVIGQRRDEISDLGHDFDYMAEHLQVMIDGQKQLLQNISHELRSPLARIHVAMALAQKKDNEDVKRELDRIELEANRLESLIAQILTLSKQQESNVNNLEEYIDIADLLKTIIADAEYEAANKKCHVTLESKTNPIIRANGELLHRALENVIRNAVRYTTSSSTVSVVLQKKTQNDCIDISICDEGPGVPEEFLSSLFEPFVRVANSRDRDSGGYGLGLAITRHAIILHGGNVKAYNHGGGLCVKIELPLHI